jgi:streptogrisin C
MAAASPTGTSTPTPPPGPGAGAGAGARERAKETQRRLDERARQAPGEVAGWYVDEVSGKTVVSVIGRRTPASDAFVGGLDPATVAVETNAAPPRTFATTDLVGGQAIYGAKTRCSLGFPVRKGTTVVGVLTAGHCTSAAASWNGVNRGALGTVTTTRWPTDDFGMIKVSDPKVWKATGRIEGGPVVRGSTPAAVGAKVCRSGSTTGYKCGVVVSREQSVNFGGGNVVSGLTRTTACAEPGDSGGAFIEPGTGQAQGMTSGGTGNCTAGGVTFFQPVGEAMSAFGVTLVTG